MKTGWYLPMLLLGLCTTCISARAEDTLKK